MSCTFFGPDALGDDLERPFGTGENAPPLDAMAWGMEIDAHEMPGDAVLPEPLRPAGFVMA